MAIQYRTYFVDDVTLMEIQGEDPHLLVLVINGVKYELDLSQASMADFRKAMEPFLRHAEGKKLPAKIYRAVLDIPTQVSKGTIRSWWVANWKEFDLPEPGPGGRGRIPGEVEAKYYEVHRRSASGNDSGTKGGDEGAS